MFDSTSGIKMTTVRSQLLYKSSYTCYYYTVKIFGGKKAWRIKTVGTLAEKTLANLSSFA